MTARYNPYFIANEHLKLVESTLEEQYQRNYNKVLKVYPPIDSATIQSFTPQLEDALKKSSKSIDWHKNSQMVEPSYILLARSLHYLGEFEKSITAYKIVNKNALEAEDDKLDNVRHEALIRLIRTYSDYNEHGNAIAVSDFLRKETLSKNNQKLLYLNRAYIHQRRSEKDSMVNNLVKAAPLLKKAEGKSKIYFMIGQVYQELNFDALAYEHYTKCLRYNPDYELSFYAKLNRAQVFELSKETDVKKIRKFYRKLLRDAKNVDFKDKIYYDMAEFEVKQNDLDQAIDYYQQSVASSVNNNRQKGYSYWKLGQIFYDQRKNFEMAKLYYDSTIQVMPKDEESYALILQRQEVLADFVTQLNTIQLQDSLLNLAGMDSLTLNAYLDEVIDKEEALALQQKAEEEARKKKSNRKFGSDFGERNNAFTQSGRQTDQGATWYFYNSSALSQGQNEFVRRWGNRQLEDNWRRTNKESVIAADYGNETQVEGDSLSQETEVQDPAELRAGRKSQLYATIPFDSQDQIASHKLLEDAFYNLGNIYNFNLLEKDNALSTFDTLLMRYPITEYKAEVLYQMYLIYKDLEDDKQEVYKKQILSDFPNTIYARIIRNPNYQEESNAAGEKLKLVYKEAFGRYEAGDYQGATTLINQGKSGLEKNDFSDNLRLLEILIIGKTMDIPSYQFALTEFETEYPNSELLDYVAHLLEISTELQNNLLTGNKKKFIEDFDQKHSFILIYNFETYGEDELPARIDEFINSYFGGQGLSNAQLILTSAKSMIVVNSFETREQALTFFNLFNSDISPLNGLNVLDFNNFVITKDNFDIFYQTKDIENYVQFFEQHYN